MLSALMDQRGAAGAWLLGGVPLVASSLQAVSALAGNRALDWIPLIGSISESLATLDVVLAAARIFYDQTGVVFALFLLIGTAWVTQGILMFSRFGREQSYSKTGSTGAVVMSGILYGFLFLGIYSPLFTQGLDGVQLLGFFLIPVVATGSLATAYRTYSWKDQRRAESIARIKSAEQTAKSQRRTLERVLDSLPLEKVEAISPDAVREATQVKRGFYDDCETVLSEAEQALERADRMDIEHLENASHSIEQQAKALDADQAEEELETMLQSALDDVVDERFGTIRQEFVSSYGDRYQTANLSEEYRVVAVSGIDDSITISTASDGGISDQLHNVITDVDISLVDTIDLLEGVDTKINEEVLPYLHEYEKQFREIETTVDDNLQKAAVKINEIGGHTGTALERTFLRDTADNDTASAQDIRHQIENSRRSLHECELEDAIEGIEEAQSMSEEYMETIRFIQSALIPAIEREKENLSSVPHPDSRDHGFFTVSLIENLREPIRNDFGTAIELDLDQRIITLEHGVESTTTESANREPTAHSGPRDEVKYLIREVQSDAGDGTVPGETTIGVESLPTTVREADPVPEFVEFVESIDELTFTGYPEGIDNDESASSDTDTQSTGYISIKATDGQPIERATGELLDDYQTWANKIERE